jgi:hypothetical protein
MPYNDGWVNTMTEHASTSPIALRVHDQDGMAHDIHLTVAAPAGTGTLAILNPAGKVMQQFTFTRLQKSRDGKTLTCRIGFTTATLTLDDQPAPPQLRIAARAFLPLFNATYRLSQDEQQRLGAWIDTLSIGMLA